MKFPKLILTFKISIIKIDVITAISIFVITPFIKSFLLMARIYYFCNFIHYFYTSISNNFIQNFYFSFLNKYYNTSYVYCKKRHILFLEHIFCLYNHKYSSWLYEISQIVIIIIQITMVTIYTPIRTSVKTSFQIMIDNDNIIILL